MSCLIDVHNLHYVYDGGGHGLHGVTLHLRHHERVGLIGPNGAGKTTLFHALAGLLHPFEGDVMVGGNDLASPEGRRSVHCNLGIVFQNTDDQLFNATVEEDVAFGPLNLGCSIDEARQRVRQAMQAVGLDESYLPRAPFHLSGGEKRRVAIAGVLAMQPEILLLDEPNSDLDPRGRRELETILNDLSITRVISSHNLEFVLETCDRVILIDQGRVFADGPVTEVLANDALMLEHGLEVPPSLRLQTPAPSSS